MAMTCHFHVTAYGVESNPSAAMEFCLPAAHAGNAGAQCNAGWLFTGMETTKGYIDAYKWFTLAERSGYPGAAANPEKLATILSPVEIDEATLAADAVSAGDS